MVDGHLELVWSRVRGGPEGALLALLDAAEQDPRAAEGLMAAYGAMPERERARLVETIITDGRAAGRPVAATLALLLGAERNPELARAIAAGLDETLARPENDRGWVWGDRHKGGALLVRHLHGAFVEVLRLSWDGDVLEADGDGLIKFDEPQLRQRHALPEAAQSVSLDEAVDCMAEVVWRVRRDGGALPSALRGFAHVFTVQSQGSGPSHGTVQSHGAAVDVPPSDGVE